MTKTIHSMIRVLDLNRSIHFYTQALDLELADQFEFETFTLTYLRDPKSGFEVELTLNHGRETPYVHGDAYGHLAVCVENIDEVHQKLVDLALSPTPVKSMQHNNKTMAMFFFLTDPDGYKIEFLQKYGRFQ
ncbi:VOC family protein [Vibrio nigripulchritudo]|uniref:VOC family protein n=1 Tax=Vibrio nigripulchritudo TaxID=28173 RepID=UPI00248FC7A5|nr:VOC family protein [Vibrio nigripulchritudo]BDU39619.1 lactoylglutathione lyase [Vibrio nigripulchritudo]BDU45340.1 lactoylglutathione lyase [Vibrio nigripulchritudo]